MHNLMTMRIYDLIEFPNQLTNNQQCMVEYKVPQYNDRPYVVHVCLMQLNRKIKS